MKQTYRKKYLFVSVFKVQFCWTLLFFASIPSLDAQNPGVQDIVKQWIEIEESFLHEEIPLSQLLEKTDIFYASIETFRNSQMYWIYRFVPLDTTPNLAFGPAIPREISEASDALTLTAAYRAALEAGDREKAAQLSFDMNTVLINWLLWDAEMERFSGTGFFRLLIVLIVFIAITALVVLFLHRSLKLSLEKEKESSFFTQAFFFAQEEERDRISRELHDTVMQDLRSISLGMEKIGRTQEQKEREKLCDQAAAAQSDIICRLRTICDYLVPPDFRFQGLPDALRRLCLEFTKRCGIECRITIEDNFNYKNLDENKQLQVFRIIQEALTNVEKHAHAKEAIVIIREDSLGTVFIGISDNGRGFDYPSFYDTVSKEQMGIRGMIKRADILGGSLTIRSEKGEGSMVCIELPVQELPV